MGKVRDIIDKTFEYGQGRGELPGVNELGEAIRILSDSENPQSSQDDLSDFEYLRRKAYDLAHQSFGNRIYIRGLIEFTNICKNDCYYCGIRKSNSHVDRYRLTMDQILACADEGYVLGFRTFVLQGGEDAWFTDAPESYLGEACVCPKCGGHHLKADKDILDVWWDSGVSWKAVCEYRPELEYPADVYLEGSDQHRGWFQSSLLTSVGANGHAPYKAVVSQGFTLDGQGRKMSKSLGNVIDPNKVCDEMGADIIRLWVASVDTSSDVSIDHEILARTSDAYRRFRNTLRFLLSELEGQFEPETDGVAFADLLPLDKLMVARLTQVQAEVDDAYASYEFPRAYRALYDFVVTELSNVYLDALKDRLYCDKPGSLERRSAQTVLAELFSMLMRDLQPILSYTVDEAMAYAPAGCVDHQKYAALLDWYKSPITVDEANEFEGVLEASLELRSAVTKALEDARSAGTFTKSQQVRVKAVVPAEMYALLTGDKAVDLAEFYIVSDVELTQGEELSVAIEAAEGECCDRCWNYRTTVGEYNGHAHICKRCAEAL